MFTQIIVQSIIEHNKKFCMTLIMSMLVLIFLHTNAIAQEIVRSITVVTNNEVLETITVEDENGQPISGEVTATVEDTRLISVTPLDNDNSNDNSTFLIKGISEGETTISFSIEDDSVLIQKEVNVKVIDVEPSFDITVITEAGNTSNNNTFLFKLPVVLEFTDTSGSNIVNREWSINNNVIAEEDQIIQVEFEEEGIFEISLKISKPTDVGEIAETVSKTVCTTDGETASSASIFGTVIDLETQTPLSSAFVVLTGVKADGTKSKNFEITGFTGTYEFLNVRPGIYNISACNGGKFNCSLADNVVVEAETGSININFQLEKKN